MSKKNNGGNRFHFQFVTSSCMILLVALPKLILPVIELAAPHKFIKTDDFE